MWERSGLAFVQLGIQKHMKGPSWTGLTICGTNGNPLRSYKETYGFGISGGVDTENDMESLCEVGFDIPGSGGDRCWETKI